MWRKTERVNLEKKPSMRLRRAVLGCEGEFDASGRLSREPSLGFSGDVRGMIVEDQLDCSARRVSGIDKREELESSRLRW